MVNKQHLEQIVPTLEGWCTVEKAWKMVSLCIERNPKIIVESGVFGGRSLLPLAFVARDLGTVAYGVDPWTVPAALEGNESEQAHVEWWTQNMDINNIYRGFIQQVQKWSLLENCIWLRMKGHEACRCFDDGSIEFFHLDSNHSELVSCQEVEDWGPKMAPKSIWVMDDAKWPSQQKAIGMIQSLGFKIIFDGETYLVMERE